MSFTNPPGGPFGTDPLVDKVDSLVNSGKTDTNTTGKKASSSKPLTKKELEESLKTAENNLASAESQKSFLEQIQKSIDGIKKDIAKANFDLGVEEKKIPNGYIAADGTLKLGEVPPGQTGQLALIESSRGKLVLISKPTTNASDSARAKIKFLKTELSKLSGLLNGNEQKYKLNGGDQKYQSILQRIKDEKQLIQNLKTLISKSAADIDKTQEVLGLTGQLTGGGDAGLSAAANASKVGSTVTDTDEKTNEVLTAIENDKEEITKGQFNTDKIKEELAAAIEGKSVNDGKTIIENVDNYDISMLRGTFNTFKMLQDPIAYMGNLVWNYDINNPTTLVFRYALPQNIITSINKTTEQFLNETIVQLADRNNDQLTTSYAKGIASEIGQSTSEVYSKLRDYYFISIFTRKIRDYFKKELGPEKFNALDKRLTNKLGLTTLEEQADGSVIVKAPTKNDIAFTYSFKYIRYFWLWWSQVFYVNVPLKENSLNFLIDENNVLPVHAGLYFLERYYSLGNPNTNAVERLINIKKARDDNGIIIFGAQNDDFYPDGFLLGGYLNYVETFKNTNNYINKKNKPTLEYTNVVNIAGSPFFNGDEELLTPSEKKSLSNAKKVKTCKQSAKNSIKEETSLKLFYKEGNDNVLDKEPPEPGLGCDPLSSLEWDQAQNIFFKKETIKASVPRVNFSIPYYNVLGVKTNNMIPAELDIFARGLETSNGQGSAEFKYRSAFTGLSTRLMLNVADKRLGDVLVDNDLIPSFKGSPSTKLAGSFFDKEPNWGPQYIIDKIPFFNPEQTPYFQLALLPYIGAYNVGYQVNKTRRNATNDGKKVQTFYINAVDGALTSYLEGADSLSIYDSQVRYGTGYAYDIKQIISFVDIEYKYKNVDLVLLPTKKEADTLLNLGFNLGNSLYSEKTELQKAKDDLAEVNKELLSANFADAPKLQLKKAQLTAKIIGLEAKEAAEKLKEDNTTGRDDAEVTTKIAPRTAILNFEYSDIIYRNNIKVVKTGEVENSISYIDLPPPAPYLRLFPKRGVSNKLIFSFGSFSQAKRVESKSVPKKYWTEGWSDAKKFYLELSEASPETVELLGSPGVGEVPLQEMYFAKGPVKKIKLYASKGKKPKDLLEMKEFKEIDILRDGFTKELTIESNVPYYFAAKAVSLTDLESYYSEVYEVQLLDDGGTVFPLINVVELESETNRKSKITLSNKFRIEPAILQQAPNPSKDDVGYLTPSVFLAPGETKPRFKVRLTSNKTGRKIDFNVIYKKFFNKKSTTAGNLNLDVVDESKILVSYKTSFEPPAAPEDEEDIDFFNEKPPADNLELGVRPTLTAEVNQTVTAGLTAPTQKTTSQTITPSQKPANPCCKFFTKPPLFPTTKTKGQSTWAIIEPPISEASPAVNELNAKLLKLNVALAKIDDDEDTIYKVLESMTLEEKCYICKRNKEYAGPRSMLATIQDQLTASEFRKVLKILECEFNFGFSEPSGGNPKSSSGIELNVGLAAKKCNQTITETTLEPEEESGAETQALPTPILDESGTPKNSPYGKKTPI
tara:strand:+ start:28697 stop:33313 length:4617 start_codon:yes stop_codon:yes gene_type:complete